jgi:hypothetical protein
MAMTTKTARLHAVWVRLAALLVLLLVLGVLAPRAGAQTTSITFFHYDVLGSPAVATDANGAVVWKESYLPYGHRLQAPAAGANNKLWYAGKQRTRANSWTPIQACRTWGRGTTARWWGGSWGSIRLSSKRTTSTR